MTSCGICWNCQGEVTLYENIGEEFGKKWMFFEGRCPNCGQMIREVDGGSRAEYARMQREDEINALRREREEMDRLEREYRATLSPKELLDYLGPECYPWWKVYVHNERVKAGSVQFALTEEDAKRRGTILARKGQWITVEDPHGNVADQWQDGTRPDLYRIKARSRHDYVIHDTGQRVETSGGIGIFLSLNEAREAAEREKRYWLGRSATFYEYEILDDDGNVLEASV